MASEHQPVHEFFFSCKPVRLIIEGTLSQWIELGMYISPVLLESGVQRVKLSWVTLITWCWHPLMHLVDMNLQRVVNLHFESTNFAHRFKYFFLTTACGFEVTNPIMKWSRVRALSTVIGKRRRWVSAITPGDRLYIGGINMREVINKGLGWKIEGMLIWSCLHCTFLCLADGEVVVIRNKGDNFFMAH